MQCFGNETLVSHRQLMVLYGEFAVAGGAITGGSVKFKKNITVTRQGVGLYTLNLWSDPGQVVPQKGLNLKNLTLVFKTPPGGATEGGWSYTITDPTTLASAGNVQVRIAQQSWAAADPVQTIGVELIISPEANT